jgi:hypothetical protein
MNLLHRLTDCIMRKSETEPIPFKPALNLLELF